MLRNLDEFRRGLCDGCVEDKKDFGGNMSCCKTMEGQLDPKSTEPGFLFAGDDGKLTIIGYEQHFIIINNCPWCGQIINEEEVKSFWKEKR